MTLSYQELLTFNHLKNKLMRIQFYFFRCKIYYYTLQGLLVNLLIVLILKVCFYLKNKEKLWNSINFLNYMKCQIYKFIYGK